MTPEATESHINNGGGSGGNTHTHGSRASLGVRHAHVMDAMRRKVGQLLAVSADFGVIIPV